MKKIICFVVFFGFFNINGLAQSSELGSVNHYIESCQTYNDFKEAEDRRAFYRDASFSDGLEWATCAAYISGAVHMAGNYHVLFDSIKDKFISTFGSPPVIEPPSAIFCLPEEVTNDQLIRVALKYMENHPEFLHVYAAFSILAALKEAFPCSAE